MRKKDKLRRKLEKERIMTEKKSLGFLLKKCVLDNRDVNVSAFDTFEVSPSPEKRITSFKY